MGGLLFVVVVVIVVATVDFQVCKGIVTSFDRIVVVFVGCIVEFVVVPLFSPVVPLVE